MIEPLTPAHAIIALIWLILVVIAGTTHYFLRARWTRLTLGALLLPLVGVAWALTLPRRRRAPAQVEDEDKTSLPPRTLPDPIATEDDYDSSNTLPGAGPDLGAGDHDLAKWLDDRAERKAD